MEIMWEILLSSVGGLIGLSAVGLVVLAKRIRDPYRMVKTEVCACSHHRCFHKKDETSCTVATCGCQIFIPTKVPAARAMRAAQEETETLERREE